MPTGYTSAMYNGKDITFQQFAMQCARQFGACIRMRDEPNDIEIPEFQPDQYHINALKESLEEKSAFDMKTEAELRAEYKAEVQAEEKRVEEANAESKEIEKRYRAMLEQARSWIPPTPDHQNLKKFMIEQLESSLNFDCHDHSKYADIPVSFQEWKKKKIDKFAWNEKYHREGYEKECANVARSNAWIKALKDSI